MLGDWGFLEPRGWVLKGRTCGVLTLSLPVTDLRVVPLQTHGRLPWLLTQPYRTQEPPWEKKSEIHKHCRTVARYCPRAVTKRPKLLAPEGIQRCPPGGNRGCGLVHRACWLPLPFSMPRPHLMCAPSPDLELHKVLLQHDSPCGSELHL